MTCFSLHSVGMILEHRWHWIYLYQLYLFLHRKYGPKLARLLKCKNCLFHIFSEEGNFEQPIRENNVGRIRNKSFKKFNVFI